MHTTSGAAFTSKFGECTYANRQVQVICKGTSFEIIEDVGISNRRSVVINYKQVREVYIVLNYLFFTSEFFAFFFVWLVLITKTILSILCSFYIPYFSLFNVFHIWHFSLAILLFILYFIDLIFYTSYLISYICYSLFFISFRLQPYHGIMPTQKWK